MYSIFHYCYFLSELLQILYYVRAIGEEGMAIPLRVCSPGTEEPGELHICMNVISYSLLYICALMNRRPEEDY